MRFWVPTFGSFRTVRAVSRDTRGSVTLEYVVVYALVGLVVAAGAVAIGPAVVRNYSAQRQVLYQSSP